MKPMTHNKPNKTNEDDWMQMSDITDYLFNPVGKSVAFVEFIGNLFFNIVRLALVPAELLFRRNFGERYFNLYLYIGGSLWLGLFATGWLNITSGFGLRLEGIVPNGVIFSVIALIFYGRMFRELFFRRFGDIDTRMYGYYAGDPLPFLYRLPFATDNQGNPREYIIRQIHEPVFMFVLGLVCTFVLNPQTGTFLIISAFCAVIKEYVTARHYRNILLDQVDAEIIGRNMAAALKGEAPKNTQGVYIAGVSTDGKDQKVLNDLKEKTKQRFAAEGAE